MSPFVALLMGGGYWSPVDLTAPAAVAVLQARMLCLSEGMTHHEVDARLGLADQAAAGGIFGSLDWHAYVYPVGRTHNLTLDYRYDWKREVWLLRSATLQVDDPTYTVVPLLLGQGLALPKPVVAPVDDL